jgi:HEPN domain-containing protein
MEFDVEKTKTYWMESAEYDLETAKSLFEKGRYPYALFFGHLALEKLLKALVVKQTRQHAPCTHSLPLLASRLSFEIPDEFKRKFAKFMEFYFEARYPEEQKKFYQKCTRKFTEQNLNEVEDVFRWLKERL